MIKVGDKVVRRPDRRQDEFWRTHCYGDKGRVLTVALVSSAYNAICFIELMGEFNADAFQIAIDNTAPLEDFL